MLSKSGIDYGALSPVQLLSLVGSSAMGALCYVPETKMPQAKWEGSFDEMQQMALEVLSEKTEDKADVRNFHICARHFLVFLAKIWAVQIFFLILHRCLKKRLRNTSASGRNTSRK